jgi:hypothetical protein
MEKGEKKKKTGWVWSKQRTKIKAGQQNTNKRAMPLRQASKLRAKKQ